jgi:glucose-6-phosphate 1-dehydrogenase
VQKLDTFDMVLFGGTGDLALRKLVPALYRRHVAGQMGPSSRVLAVARTKLSKEEYLAQIEASCRKHLAKDEFTEARWHAFAAQVDYVQVDATEAKDFRKLHATLEGREDAARVIFLSTAPSLFTLTCDNLAAAAIVTPKSRVVLEKPLGHDRASAELINRSVGAIFAEQQIYRIDHYLGKETVQNLIALRFGNTLFEPLWRRGRIRHVQITIAEQLGVEGRGQFYEHTGALRDMVQNHLLQLVCILAMEPPTSSDPDAVRDEKLKVLRALRPIVGSAVQSKTVRGQYRAGAVSGQPVPSYLDEAGVAADSTTETFVALKAEIDTWRWAGVPFYLRTGKYLKRRVTEIAIRFHQAPYTLFRGTDVERMNPNWMILRIQPNEGIALEFAAKRPGPSVKLSSVSMDFAYKTFFRTEPNTGYETLIFDCMIGDATLFQRADNIEAGWQAVQPILDVWANNLPRDFPNYAAGTSGPAAADELLARDGRAWRPLD